MSRRNCSNNFCKEELDRLNDKSEVELEGGMCRERYPLGSAYVPKQSWGKTYEAGVNKAALLEFISTASFVLDDLRLYLDTHPKDKNAVDMYSDYQKIRAGAVADYEKYCGPLNQCSILEDNKWIWVKGPWPWQGEV